MTGPGPAPRTLLPRPRLLDGLPADGALTLPAHNGACGPLPAPGRVSRTALLEAVERSGLRGRGGAGFPTGRKMRAVALAGRPSVVVANGCDGEPTSHKDSLLVTRLPHLVLDGMQVAARVVGAEAAHLLVHRGSPAAAAARRAVAERNRVGLDPVRVAVQEIPAWYVASEESAAVHWLNGGAAKPTFTPPRPFEQGVDKRPTLVNNVETLAQVALLARHGPDWFRAVGDPGQPGTMLVTVTGPPAPPRVVEVATGVRMQAVLDACGSPGEPYQAVLVGGYFGTWLPAARAAELPLTSTALAAAGGALGAGIVFGLPAEACGLAETARVAGYLAAHSAGQCGPCIRGLPAIAGALHRLAFGPWEEALAPHLDRWLAIVPGRGACRHPDGAVRFVASALSVFAGDVAAHRGGRPCRYATARPWLPLPTAAPGSWR